MRTTHHTPVALAVAAALALGACAEAEENQTGSEYMPDMAHSIAYESNTFFDYYQNTWDSASVKDKYELAQPGTPVQGTVPRGYAGYYLAGLRGAPESASGGARAEFAAQEEAMEELYGLAGAVQARRTPLSPKAPYYYVDTEEDRLRAAAEVTENPFPITADGLKRGAELYNTFCAICHGESGNGNGWIYENGAYPAAPRNFLVQEWVDTSAGLYYHAFMYGKNVMGAYKDKVSYEERWQIIHHIRALQAKEFEAEYTEASNTLVPAEASPIANRPQYARFLESFSREPIEVESEESSAPDVVGEAPGERVQLGEVNPAEALDTLPVPPEGEPLQDELDGSEDSTDDTIE